MVKEVRWPMQVQTQLAKAYDYILTHSYQNAENVKRDILASTHRLATHPEMYPPDKYRKDNDASFRAYELHHYRVAYRIMKMKLLSSGCAM